MARLSHDQLARRIAKKLGGVYNPGKGADIRIGNRVIEVEAHPRTFSDGIRQLQGYSGYRYLGVNNIDVSKAIQRTEHTKIGVIDAEGRTRKSAQYAR